MQGAPRSWRAHLPDAVESGRCDWAGRMRRGSGQVLRAKSSARVRVTGSNPVVRSGAKPLLRSGIRRLTCGFATTAVGRSWHRIRNCGSACWAAFPELSVTAMTSRDRLARTLTDSKRSLVMKASESAV